MNNWTNEYMAEYRRQDLIKESEQIRTEDLAPELKEYKPGKFARIIHSFAGWMILTGIKLHALYELPAAHSHHVPSNSFAN